MPHRIRTGVATKAQEIEVNQKIDLCLFPQLHKLSYVKVGKHFILDNVNDLFAYSGNAQTGEEIEFSVASVSSIAAEPSELRSLTEFIRHQATD